MIDINHPNSQFIFEASGYTDRIKNYCIPPKTNCTQLSNIKKVEKTNKIKA
jgi:hypothetical protein